MCGNQGLFRNVAKGPEKFSAKVRIFFCAWPALARGFARARGIVARGKWEERRGGHCTVLVRRIAHAHSLSVTG